MIYLVGLIWRVQKKAQACKVCNVVTKHYQNQFVYLRKKATGQWFISSKRYPVCRECAD